jgi:hypothetical protein
MLKTWKAPRHNGMEGLIQRQNEQLVLTYLLAASISEDASFSTKATVLSILDDLKSKAAAEAKKTSTDKGYYLLTLERMKNPDKAKPTLHAVIPPGAPIGVDDNEFFHF